MTDPALFAVAAAATAGLGLIAAAALRGWRGWLDLRRLELGGVAPSAPNGDLRKLRERVRRLEAIAEGRDA